MIHDGLQALDDALWIDEESAERKNTFAIDSRDVGLHYYYNLVMTDPTPENHAALQAEIAHRVEVDALFEKMFGVEFMEKVRSGDFADVEDFDCYRSMISTYEEKCQKLDDYSLKYARAFVEECETVAYKEGIDGSLAKIINACQD